MKVFKIYNSIVTYKNLIFISLATYRLMK